MVEIGVNNWSVNAVERVEKTWYSKLGGHVEVAFEEVLSDAGPVVDMGCGLGRLVAYAEKKGLSGLEYLGLDGSRAMVTRFRELHPDYADRVSHRNLLRALPGIDTDSTCLCMAVLIHLTLSEQKKVLRNILAANPKKIVFDLNFRGDGSEIEKTISLDGQPFRMTYNSPETIHKYICSMFGNEYRVSTDDYEVQKGIIKRLYVLNRFRKKLSIIMGTRNETVFLNLTVRSAIEELKAVEGGSEIIVVDNSDRRLWESEVEEDGTKKTLRGAVQTMIPYRYLKLKKVKLIRQEAPCFTAARMTAARAASGEYLFCVDSHVLFGRDVLKDAVAFMDRHEGDEKLGFGHSPICWAGQFEGAKKHQLAPKPGAHHGWNWAGYREKESRISWKFMPWICRRDWYLDTLRGYGCLADNMVGWGGAELLQQVKALLMGYENWAIPGSPVIHIGPYGSLDRELTGYRYRTYGSSGKYPPGMGVLAAFYVLMGDQEGLTHVRTHQDRMMARYSLEITDEKWEMAKEIGREERAWLADRQVMTYQEMLEKRPWESTC